MDSREAYVPEDISSGIRSDAESPAIKESHTETPRSTTLDLQPGDRARPTILNPGSVFALPVVGDSGLSESLDRLTRPMTVQRVVTAPQTSSASVGRAAGLQLYQELQQRVSSPTISQHLPVEPQSAKSTSSRMSLIEELKLNHARYHTLTIKRHHTVKFNSVVARIRELSQKGKSSLKIFEPLEAAVIEMLEAEGIKYIPDKKNRKEAILTWIY